MKKTVKATKNNIAKLPDSPGMYMFKSGREVLYVGKATSLSERVRSYFSNDLLEARGPLLVKLLSEATSIVVETTDSVIEALILEAKLIKEYQPRFNTKEKSDTSFNWVIITDEDYPRVLLIRERELEQQKAAGILPVKYEFGPFTQGGALKEALRIIRKIFPFIDTKKPVSELSESDKRRLSLNRQIGLYPDVFSGQVTKIEYQRTIQHLRLFFEGRKQTLLKKMEREMKALAKLRRFEDANVIKKQIFAIQHIRDVSVLKREVSSSTKRLEAYDVAHLAGKAVVGVMTVVVGSEPDRSQYRKFKIKYRPGINDTQALKEIIFRRLGHSEWPLPRLIVVDGGKAQVNTARKTLSEAGVEIPVVGVVKNEFHQPREIIGSIPTGIDEADVVRVNSEAHRFAVSYHRQALRRGLTK